MKPTGRLAAAAALAVIALAGCAGQGDTGDPYWATCDQLADEGARAQVARQLTKRAELPTLTSSGVADRLENICGMEVGAYRPGLDAVRLSQSASIEP